MRIWTIEQRLAMRNKLNKNKYYIDNGGYKVLNNRLHPVSNKQHLKEHKMIWYDNYGAIPKGYVIHHKNGNKLDNKIENLELMDKKEHARMHQRKYTNDNIKTLIEIHNQGISFGKLALLTGIHKRTILRLVHSNYVKVF